MQGLDSQQPGGMPWGGQSRGISNSALSLPAVKRCCRVGVLCCTVPAEDFDLLPLRHAKL